MSKINQAKEVLGECFITGFPGKSLNSETISFWKKSNMGGTLIFTHNFESPEQIVNLCNQIQGVRKDLPLWISIDYEGGRVQRFRKGVTLIPKALSVAQTGSTSLAKKIAAMTARELHSMGINISFAPVADVNTNPENPIIGDRAFGDDAETVSQFVRATTEGLLSEHIQPCVKHFPGHGDTHEDSHLALPKVDTDATTLRSREFLPFSEGFKAGCNMVMTAHMLVPSLDPKVPATFSTHILNDILRGELGFQGLIISDDLEMKAITDHFGEEESPRLALEAGCDLLIYRSEMGTLKAYEALIHALEDGKLSPDCVLRAAKRSQDLKRRTLLPYKDASWNQAKAILGTEAHQKLVQEI